MNEEVVEEKPEPVGECLGRYKHKFNWVWKINPQTQVSEMTNEVACINCDFREVRIKGIVGGKS